MTTSNTRPARRFVLIALIFPVVIAGLALILQLLALPQVPDPVAVHWNLLGDPDGFAPGWLSIVLTVVLVWGLPVVMALPALIGLRRGDSGPTYRLMGALSPALSVFLAVLVTGSLLVQRGLSDAANAPSIAPVMIVAAAGALVVGVIAWMLQPDSPRRTASIPVADQPPLAASEAAVWLQSVRLAPAGLIALSVGVGVLLVVAATALLVGAPGVNIVIPLVTLAVVALALSTTAAFHVRVDATGLTVNSVFGLPRIHVPLSEIERVEAVEVTPLGEFGGWGLRWAAGSGFGVVLRSGAGIRVHRRNGRIFTVTVDDAATGAGLLAAELERSRRER